MRLTNAVIPAFMASAFMITPAGVPEVQARAIKSCLATLGGAKDDQSPCMTISGAPAVCETRDDFAIALSNRYFALGVPIKKLSCHI